MPKSHYISHLFWCGFPPRYLNEVQRHLAPLSFPVSYEEARYFTDATTMPQEHQGAVSDEYFEPGTLPDGTDAHELEIRVEAPRRVIQQLASEIQDEACARAAGVGLNEPPSAILNLAKYVDEHILWKLQEFLVWPPPTWEPHYAKKRVFKHYLHGTSKQICMGPMDVNHLIKRLTAREALTSVCVPHQLPPLPPMSKKRQFVLVDQLVPLQFQVWQHAGRGMELRNRSEKSHTGGDQDANLRDVLRAQSSNEVVCRFIGTAELESVNPEAFPEVPGPGKLKRRRESNTVPEDKVRTDFSRFVMLARQCWFNFQNLQP